MSEVAIELRDGDEAIDGALAVRQRVFVEEQGVSEDMEYDGRDGEAIHALARVDGDTVGTGRLREPETGTGKIERVAVLREYRERGVGRRLVTTLESVARERGLERLVLHGQVRVEEFYQSLGYETTSDVYEEAGMPHVTMEKRLTDEGAD